MNWKLLGTMVTLIGVGASVALGQGTSTTILQGNYITNVFGNSNFVLNPNAQTNITNVTVSNATVTRSTTTPLVATSEFNVTVTSANGTIAWNTRAFDQGMKGQNCEARFTYRGFQSTSVAQVRQGATVAGANIVARLALTPSTDPRIASINFPCGDLSQPTYFVITDTATLSGTHEIGGAYIGLATNMANVAQAEVIGGITFSTGQNWTTASSSYADFGASGSVGTAFGNCTAPSTAVPHVTCNLTPGNYEIVATSAFVEIDTANNGAKCRIFDGTNTVAAGQVASYNTGTGAYTGKALTLTGRKEYTTAQSVTFKVQCSNYSSTATVNYSSSPAPYQIIVKRFPSSSELVVTPERQNVFGGVVYRTSSSQLILTGVAASSSFSSFTNAVWNQPTMLKGKASVSTTNAGNDLGFSMPNLPVGHFKLSVSGFMQAQTLGASGVQRSRCNFKIRETTTAADVAISAVQNWAFTTGDSRDYPHAFHGVFSNLSVGTRNFILQAAKFDDPTPGSASGCTVYNGDLGWPMDLIITIEPLDQPSNSALYVQGPVKAAETGAAIPAGYVGQTKTASGNNYRTSGTASDWTNITGAQITVEAGNWLVCANGQQFYYNPAGGANLYQLGYRMQNTTDASTIDAQYVRGVYSVSHSDNGSAFSLCKPISVTSTKTLNMQCQLSVVIGSFGFGVHNCESSISAIRLN